MSRASDDAAKDGQGSSTHAALARTLTRSAALYFSRPVRLFRPTKISGWHSLRGAALHAGASLNPQFVAQLVKTQGFRVIPKHFIPPLIINAALGTVLWATYAETSAALATQLDNYPISVAALSGGVAGGMQAIVAAPAENLRLAIEGGSTKGGGWSHAWQEVFRGTASDQHLTRQERLRNARQVREWMKEVRGMAGRGWDGWGWGLAKDVGGFSVFFAIFEVTRRVAATFTSASQDLLGSNHPADGRATRIRRHTPRVVHGITLVSGGVVAGLAYEFISRPFDVARRLVYLDRIESATQHTSRHYLVGILARHLRDHGMLSLFRDPAAAIQGKPIGPQSRRQMAFKTLARVGPWGVGFLVWEAFGPGIS
ncbi:hypothetical protein BV25DRAFT_1850911 [Artomyces pyxidatus]|uniref:Uncharacterized protein n=1 Tax=Artomyces pyxidatus TaxID=48021 RepID=A0ACB8TAZ2_9AGAM|nr:hypothetical protein BV25DRAFT_1850911 [Artomyces pyxidatus]